MAPASSHAGRWPLNVSSMTHMENGSAGTGTASTIPARATAARVASVVRGTIRSTIVSGEPTVAR